MAKKFWIKGALYGTKERFYSWDVNHEMPFFDLEEIYSLGIHSFENIQEAKLLTIRKSRIII